MRSLVLFKGGALLFLSMLLWSVLVMTMANNMLFLWILLEVNMLSFIPLMKSGMSYKVNSAMMKYFLIQSLGSFFILYSILVQSSVSGVMLVFLGLVIKLGNPPSFIWLPSVMKSMEWRPVILLSTLQKVPPLIIFSGLVNSVILVMAVCMLGFIVSGLGGVIQSHLMSLMAYSSMAHMSWTMLGMVVSNFVGWFYFIIYSFSVMCLFILFGKSSWYKLSELGGGGVYLWLSLMMTLSLAGMPPFIGFFSKMMVFQLLGGLSYMIILIILSFIGLNLYFYSNVSFLIFSGKSDLSGEVKFSKVSILVVMIMILVMFGGFVFF